MVLRLIVRSPREPGFLAPVASRFVSAKLGLSVGRPGPHTFAVRVGDARLASPPRPSHPASTSVTTRTPLSSRRDKREKSTLFRKTEEKFWRKPRISDLSLNCLGKFLFFQSEMSDMAGARRGGTCPSGRINRAISRERTAAAAFDANAEHSGNRNLDQVELVGGIWLAFGIAPV